MVPISIEMLRLLDESPLQPFNREKCSTCCYREPNVEGAFCYMFKHQPQCDCGAYRKYV